MSARGSGGLHRRALGVVLGLAGALRAAALEPAVSPEGIPRHRERQILEAAPAEPAVRAAKERRVLVWSTPDHLAGKDPHKGYCVPYGACAFRLLGEKTGAYRPVVTNDLAFFRPEVLRTFDAIVMNNSCGPWITPDAAAMARLKDLGATPGEAESALRKALVDFVERGGGIAACHYAIAANKHWPGFAEMMGATFTGHPWNEEVAVRVEEPGHPLVAAFGGRDFKLADEIYQFGPPYDRANLRVLLALDAGKINLAAQGVRRTDRDFAQAWVKPCGKGRIFYTGFGHRTEIWWNPAILRFLLDGVQFAVGDLPAPADPRR